MHKCKRRHDREPEKTTSTPSVKFNMIYGGFTQSPGVSGVDSKFGPTTPKPSLRRSALESHPQINMLGDLLSYWRLVIRTFESKNGTRVTPVPEVHTKFYFSTLFVFELGCNWLLVIFTFESKNGTQVTPVPGNFHTKFDRFTFFLFSN